MRNSRMNRNHRNLDVAHKGDKGTGEVQGFSQLLFDCSPLSGDLAWHEHFRARN